MDEHARHTPTSLPARAAALALLAGCALATAQPTGDDPFAEPLTVFRETDPIPPTETGTRTQSTDDEPASDDETWVDRITRERLGDQRTRLLAEGTFLTARTGTLLTSPSGHRVFVPDKESRRVGEGPMVVLPSRTLARLDIATSRLEEPRVALSGQILVFGGRNLLLPTAYRVLTDAPPASGVDTTTEPRPGVSPRPGTPSPEPEPSTGDAQPDAGSAADDPDVASLFDELDSPTAPRGLQPPTESPDESDTPLGPDGRPDAPSIPDDTVVAESHQPEGTSIVRRRGRLVRLPDGAWAVVFDNDHDGGADADPPLTVYPCRVLTRLVPMAERSGDSLELLISGRVYAYGSRRYILPTLFQRPARGTGVDPHQ